MAGNHVFGDSRWRGRDAYSVAKDEQSALLETEFCKRHLLRMVVVLGRVDAIEGLYTSAELCSKREDFIKYLSFGLARFCRLDPVGRRFGGHCGAAQASVPGLAEGSVCGFPVPRCGGGRKLGRGALCCCVRRLKTGVYCVLRGVRGQKAFAGLKKQSVSSF